MSYQTLLIFFSWNQFHDKNSWTWFHEKNLFFSSDIRDSLGTNCNTLSLHIKSIDVHASDLMWLLSLHTRHRALVHLSITTSKMLFTFIFSSIVLFCIQVKNDTSNLKMWNWMEGVVQAGSILSKLLEATIFFKFVKSRRRANKY